MAVVIGLSVVELLRVLSSQGLLCAAGAAVAGLAE